MSVWGNVDEFEFITWEIRRLYLTSVVSLFQTLVRR